MNVCAFPWVPPQTPLPWPRASFLCAISPRSGWKWLHHHLHPGVTFWWSAYNARLSVLVFIAGLCSCKDFLPEMQQISVSICGIQLLHVCPIHLLSRLSHPLGTWLKVLQKAQISVVGLCPALGWEDSGERATSSSDTAVQDRGAKCFLRGFAGEHIFQICILVANQEGKKGCFLNPLSFTVTSDPQPQACP